MFLPPIKRLSVEDFPGQNGWIGKLIQPLNQLFTSLTVGLNKGLTFQENISSQIQTLTIVAPAVPIYIKGTLSTLPSMVIVGRVQDVSSSPQALTGAVFPVWDYQGGQLRITELTGLVSGQTYKITFLILP